MYRTGTNFLTKADSHFSLLFVTIYVWTWLKNKEKSEAGANRYRNLIIFAPHHWLEAYLAVLLLHAPELGALLDDLSEEVAGTHTAVLVAGVHLLEEGRQARQHRTTWLHRQFY